MTKILPLAASMMLLVAVSGQAFARTAPPNTRHRPQVTDLSAYGAFDQMPPTSAAEFNTHRDFNTHRYEGGPKSND
ncbi:hypothetical protein [Bradyrhizobium erythrophlei]|jgi:hypothetical protein|uniref:Uncharacterized protein n=1 Tax=Bradyrhizobium erythrophlei TaxID=1437360 RepID=A0A1M5L2N7_9BRAD|nr:hypothetical protein [Bradyrhizobium erythrophlei]SHG59298.1 hypothetical protein SAMN05444169_3224 [Bradyrhizobium erythrophlei]